VQARYHAAGLTGIIDPGVTPQMMQLDQRLWARGELDDAQRAHAAGRLEPAAAGDPLAHRRHGPGSGFGDARLKLGGVKVFLDGGASLGTALMREPYPDDARCNCGIQITPTESFREIVRACARHGWSIGVHTVGGAAIDIALDVFEEVDRERPLREVRPTDRRRLPVARRRATSARPRRWASRWPRSARCSTPSGRCS
jgi:predicted amidohydrolase YtcJ